ncbi:MAG: Rieske 2Fe-2S domain-containing protein [Planctomycetota bacterium]|nr:Rieske 2Fe-2S domain-containing protein [Planctomycetota bacterium]
MTRTPRAGLHATLPATAYSGREEWESDRERVFARAWQPLEPGQIPSQPGSAQPCVLLPGFLDEPLLLTRDAEGALHALSNACTHRGAMVCPDSVQARELRCPYHGRRFGLDGRFRGAPGFENTLDFPRAEDDLPRVAIEALGPLQMIALAPAQGAADWGAAASERFDALGWSAFRHDPAGERSFPLRANWALYVENYLEGFHVPFVHPELSRALDLSRYTTQAVAHGVLQVAEARDGEAAIEPPAGHPDHGRRVAAWYLWLFPNLMLNVYPWGLSLNVIEPRGPLESVVRYHRFLRDPRLLEQGAGAGLDQVEGEDQTVVESVQRGIRSRLWRGGVLSPQHEQGIARFHALWSEARRL